MPPALFICGHSAGGHKDDGAMLATAAALEARGIEVVRFNFPYRERGSRMPDRMPELKAAFAAVAEPLRGRGKLILGGRSMGGRVATMLAADGFACDGLLLFAYPLHPAGKPEKLRDAHLPAIRVPVLCFNGTRDKLCTRELMEKALTPVKAPWTMHWLEGADHSLKGEPLMKEMADAAARWIAALC
ncbi:MAG TPA: alpha/beta family hydrolase [Burkholderiales bacterium]|nr:alpha/beta family hydrolase [Burkholderiales bacterium]